MLLEDKKYILDDCTSAQSIYELVDWMLWETPTILTPSYETVKNILSVLEIRYNKLNEQIIKDCINECNLYLNKD